MAEKKPPHRRYVFADEYGDFNLGGRGATDYYAIGTITVESDIDRMFIESTLSRVRHDLIWDQVPLHQGFHAAPDLQLVRDAVYRAMQSFRFRFQATAVDKASLQYGITDSAIYGHAWHHHAVEHGGRIAVDCDELVVVAGAMGTTKTKGEYLDMIRSALMPYVHPATDVRFVGMRDDAEACIQVADYCLWALMRAREKRDGRSLMHIERFIDSESIVQCTTTCEGPAAG